jgi:DNA-binding transcriptional ArsR family regulator
MLSEIISIFLLSIILHLHFYLVNGPFELKRFSKLIPIHFQIGDMLIIRTAQTLIEAGVAHMSESKNPLKYLLGWLIAGTRGGLTRAKILMMLKEAPQNANQLASKLKMDYRTIRHHLEVLERNNLVVSTGEGYGTTYFLSPVMEENYALFEEIVSKIWKK